MKKTITPGACTCESTRQTPRPARRAKSVMPAWKSKNFEQEKKAILGDTATIKRMLDDAVVEVLLDSEDDSGLHTMFVEDTSMSNMKLFVGFSAVGASLLSHVFPAPFPHNWWCLLFCCTYYFAASGVLQLLLSFVELESILLLTRRAPKVPVPGLNISTHFPRFQSTYTLGITPIPGGAITSLARAPAFQPEVEGGNTSKHSMQRSWKVEHYFDEEGVFAEEDFMKSVAEFLAQYTAMLQADWAEGKKQQ